MAKVGGSRGARGRPGRPGRDAASQRSAKSGIAKSVPQKKAPARPAAEPDADAPQVEGPFILGAIPGATPGKWIDTWYARFPDVTLELRAITVADQREALVAHEVDAALIRLPIDQDGLHVIALYDELPVVVAAADSHLMAADELDLADLAGEVIIAAKDDVLAVEVPGGVAASFAPPHDTEEAIAVVAAGIGVVVVPMSLARQFHRKDADYRPLRGGPVSTVALAWPADRTTPAVDAFVGIVRGRTANSSR